MPKQEIRVEFNAIGDKKLLKSLHQLANATNKLNAQTKNATQEANLFGLSSSRVTAGAKKQKGGIDGLLGSFAFLRNKMLLAAFGYNMLLKPFANVTRAAVNQAAKFQSLQVRLTQLFGSLGEGKAAFDQFNAAAAKTPFALEDIVNAGAQLKAFGADSRELLTEITDLAAFMGTNATEAANAFGRAFAGGAGAADILRERGILNLVKEFKGIEDLSKLTLPEFREALLGAMRDPLLGIKGATEAMADTYQGKLSNMQDATQRMSASLGNFLMPAAEASVGFITELAGAIGDFFDEVNNSDLGNLVRDLEDMGVAAKDLAALKITLNNVEALASIQEIADGLRTLALTSTERTLGEMFMDFEPMTLGLGFGKTRIKGMKEINDFLKDELGQTISDLENSFLGKGDFFDPEDTKSMAAALQTLLPIMEETRQKALALVQASGDQTDATKEEMREHERNMNFLKGLATSIAELIKVKKNQAELDEYLKNLQKGEDPKPDTPKIDQKFIDFTLKLNKILERSKEVRLEEVRSMIKQHKAYKESGRYRKESSFNTKQYNIILAELIALEEQILGIEKKKPKEALITKTEFKTQIEEAVAAYKNLQTILEELDTSGFWRNVPESLQQHSDAYIEQVDLNKKLESAFLSTEDGQKRNIQSTINLIEQYDGLKLSTADLTTLTDFLTEKMNNVGKATTVTKSAYDKWYESQVASFTATANETKFIQKLKDSYKSLEPEVQKVIEASGIFNALLPKGEQGYIAFTKSITDNAQANIDNEAHLKRFKEELKKLPPELRTAVEAMNLFTETDISKMTLPEFEAKVREDFDAYEREKTLIDDLVKLHEGNASAYSNYIRTVVGGIKPKEQINLIDQEHQKTIQGQIRALDKLKKAVEEELKNIDATSMSQDEYNVKTSDAAVVVAKLEAEIQRLNDRLNGQVKNLSATTKAYGDFELEVLERVFASEKEKELIDELIFRNYDLAKAAGYVKDEYEDLVSSVKDRIRQIKDEQDAVMLLEFRNKDLYDQAVEYNLVQSKMTKYQKNMYQEQVKVEKELYDNRATSYLEELSTLTHIRSKSNRLNLSISERIELEGIYKNKLNDTLKELRNLRDVRDDYTGGTLGDTLFKGAEDYEEKLKRLEGKLSEVQQAAKMTSAEFALVSKIDPGTVKAQSLFVQFIKQLELDEEKIKQVIDNINQKISKVDKMQEYLSAFRDITNSFSNVSNLLSEQTQRKVENDIKALKSRDEYINASQEKREDMEESVRKKYQKEVKRDFYFNQAAAVAGIAIDTASAIMKTVGKTGFFGMPMALIMGSLGAAQAGLVLSQKPPEYAMGGLIGGQPHSQGGTPIIAEKGEFIVRKEAVDNIGLTELTRINEGATSTNNSMVVNINNPILSKDYIEDELPELIKEAVLKGSDFGMS